MTASDLTGILDFLRAAEALKTATRSGWTSTGEPESVAEHTWRLCLMALVLHPSFPGVDLARLLKICIVHDLGEAIGGDVPAPEQARRVTSKAGDERRDLLTLLGPLPRAIRDEITALWDEYEAARTPEARLAKGLDKLETILQHTQGRNPAEFDYRFNLGYGRRFTGDHPVLVAMRELLDAETERRAREAEGGPAVVEPVAPVAPVDVEIRPARRAEVPAIVRMLADDPLGATRERPGEPLDPAYWTAFDAMAAQGGNELLVAVRGDQVLGCVQLTVIPGLSRAGMTRGQLEGVRVHAAARGQRIGEALVRAAIDRAREAGCRLVQLTSDQTRGDAIRFYERLGFTASHVGMKLALD